VGSFGVDGLASEFCVWCGATKVLTHHIFVGRFFTKRWVKCCLILKLYSCSWRVWGCSNWQYIDNTSARTLHTHQPKPIVKTGGSPPSGLGSIGRPSRQGALDSDCGIGLHCCMETGDPYCRKIQELSLLAMVWVRDGRGVVSWSPQSKHFYQSSED
jgi:hypothetical protein